MKIKLHGTNAAIRIDKNGTVTAQSRRRDLTPDDDNFSFAAWVQHNLKFFESLATHEDFIIFGEWAGHGVQDTDAVNKIDHRIFFPFAIFVNDVFFTDTYRVEAVFETSHLPMPSDIEVLPHLGYVEIDFSKQASVNAAIDDINAIVEEIETRDPYIFSKFGIDEPGEGIVGCPIFETGLTADMFRGMSFKAKTQQHRGRKAKAAASGRFDLTNDARAMALSYLTEARFQQGLREALNDELDIRRMRDFLAWMGGDIKKESEAELEAAGIEWKQIAGVISKASAEWLKERIEQSHKKAA